MVILQFVEQISVSNEVVLYIKLLPGGLVFYVDRKNRIFTLDLKTMEINSYSDTDIIAKRTVKSLRKVLYSNGKILMLFKGYIVDEHPVVAILKLGRRYTYKSWTPAE